MRRNVIESGAVALVGLAMLFASGCMKARPRYTPPASPAVAKASQWKTPLAGGEAAKPTDDATLARWWEVFHDPLLTALEDRAVKGNLDLRKAEAKIRQARAQRNVIQLGRLPSVTANGSATGSRSSSKSGSGDVGQMYSTGLDASWEPDFYGRVRQSIEAYDADLGAAQESLRDVLVSLTAELALDYIDVRSYQEQLRVTRANLASQEETYNLTVARRQSGLVTELEERQAKETVESTRAGIPTLEISLQKSINAIALLLGEAPGAADAELKDAKPLPVVPVEVAVGVPADLLRRRPDIRNAERQVAAQSARVGVAEADLYPTFTLSGSIGLDSLTILNLVTPGALASSLAGSFQHTVFSRRKIREQIKIQDAVLEQDVTAYESTVLTALKDVEDALHAFAQEQIRRKSLAEATSAAGRAAELSRDLYSVGLKDFLNVLDAERTLLTLQNQLVQSDANITADLARLYKALGGGWNAGTAPVSKP
jgi:outer membrane protein, multidrug efflux system